LVENLGGRSPGWATPSYGQRGGGYGNYASGYGPGRRPSQFSEDADQHYNYEDESQEAAGNGNGKPAAARTPNKPFVASWMTAKAKPAATAAPANIAAESSPNASPEEKSIDNIARFFGGKPGAPKPGAFARSALEIPKSTGAQNLKRNDKVRHSKYGEGTILMREGEGEDAKLTVMFTRHGMKKLMEKFANLQKI